MRKLIVSIATLGSGGAERVLSILSKYFTDEYDSVIYLLWLHHPVFYKYDKRVKIVDISQESGSNNLIRKMLWFRSYVKKEDPTLVLSFLWPWSMKVIISLLFTPFRIVVAERQDPHIVKGGILMRIFREMLYRMTSGIVVQTEVNSKYYKGDVRVIYNPVSLPGDKVGLALKVKKENVVVSVGRLIPQKNQALLIKAFGLFHQTHPNYKLIIYGEGDLKEQLNKLAIELGIDNSVEFPGNVNDVYSHLLSAKLFVLSSNYEGMPNALLEALCLGLPCISTRVSGASELIDDGYSGILVDKENVGQMSEAMKNILDHETMAYDMGREAAKVFEKTKPHAICRQWIDYINLKMQ